MANNTKKVVFYVPRFPVLSEIFIEKEVAKLASREKIDVSVLSIEKGNGVLPDVLKDRVFYNQLKLTHIFGLIPIFVFNLPKVINAYNLLTNLNTLFFNKIFLLGKAVGYSVVVKKMKPDHIHAHFLSDPSTMMMLISEITDIPYSISAHAKDVFVTSELINEKIETAEFIAVCNKNALNYLKEKAGSQLESKILLQFHGYDFTRLQNISFTEFVKPDFPLILTVGRMEEKKGHEFLVEAAKILNDSGVKFKMIIIGGGYSPENIALFKKLEDKIIAFKLENIIELHGNGLDQNSEVLKYMSVADIFVRPSIKAKSGDVEGIPNTMVEAGYFGMPLIGTNSGSIGEVLIDCTTGLTVPESDPQALANAIQKLIENPDLRSNYGQSAKNHIISNFDIEKCLPLLEDSLSK